jgi:hypothetical protein
MLFALLFTAFAAAGAGPPATTPTVVAAVVVPATTPPMPAPAASFTPVEVRPLYKVGVPVDIPSLGRGRFVPENEMYGFQVVPTDRYAEDLKYRFIGEQAGKGHYAMPGYQRWTLLVTTFIVPILVETYRAVKK